MSDQPPQAADAGQLSPADARRSGLDIARTALAAAKAEARRRGLAGRRASGAGAAGLGTPRRRSAAQDGAVQHSGAHPDDRDPQLLASSVERLLAERGWQTDVAVGAVMGRWADIVGVEVAAHSAPVSFDRGALVVQADTTAWATQLRLLAASIVRRLDDEVGPGTVTSVKVLAPQAPSWKRGRLHVRGRGARDTYG